MQIQENVSLRPFNTFGIDAKARYFASFKDKEQLAELTSVSVRSPFILGGGSNILFTKDQDELVLKNEIMGISELHEEADHVYVRAGAGENWHRFVQYCIEKGWGGVENLSLIPGNVGASPMQNIGAYGVELEEVFWNLEAFHLKDKTLVTFTKNDCGFGYRDSVFKNKYKGEYVILTVTFQLSKKPKFNISYGAIEQELEKMKIRDLSIRAISDAVINIRSSKLPDPKEIGNAGSFFKNPLVPVSKYEQLCTAYPSMVGYRSSDDTVKLAAGWLIEHSGPDEATSWKGFRRGDAGCHSKQALVLVNYGSATGAEIWHLSEDIRLSVQKKFGVDLEREVNIV